MFIVHKIVISILLRQVNIYRKCILPEFLFLCVLKLVQIIINTTHLEQACKYLEDFITNITNISQETLHTARLYGLSTFKVREMSSF